MGGPDRCRAIIRLLDGESLELPITTCMTADSLCPQVNTYCQLASPDTALFALAYVDNIGHFHWLPLDKPIVSLPFLPNNDKNDGTLYLTHCIRFFIEPVLMIVEHPITVEYYFMEVHQQLLRDELHLSELEYVSVAANILHVYAGDFNEDASAVDILRLLLPRSPRCIFPPSSSTDPPEDPIFSIEELERNILEEYMKLSGSARGLAIIEVMQIVERCATYGSRFYSVRDRHDRKITIAINGRGIYLYDPGDYVRAIKIFEWQVLDNLYYKDNKFTIEVKDPRSRGPIANLTDLGEYLGDSDEELLRAVNDPTTRVSCTRRGGRRTAAPGPGPIHAYDFFCDSTILCNTLWSAAIAQHQFYLNQTRIFTKKSRSSAHTSTSGGVSHVELSDKLNRLVSRSSIASSLPSLTSLNSASSIGAMPSAKVADGSTASLPSLKSQHSQKTEEELSHDVEQYKILIARKAELEARLVARLADLREICIEEGELTGEMPKEMKKALKPGEDVPKLKKRIGTAFEFSADFFKPSKLDAISQMESDIELHRKLVAAADKLAKDKSTNKSVRKKRQKDLVAAAQRLRGMELQLSQLRFSASKPDVSSANPNNNQNTWTAGNAAATASMRAMAKSCPTTPRGSVPDLTNGAQTDNEKSDYEDECDHKRPNSCQSCARPGGVNRFSEASTISAQSATSSGYMSSSPQGLPPKGGPQRRQTMPKSHTMADSLDNPLQPPHQLPLYENLGYRSCASYQSSYRQVHYPTLHDQNLLKKRAQSEHALYHDGDDATDSLHKSVHLKESKLPSGAFPLTPDDDDLTPCGEQRTHGSSPMRLPMSVSCQAGFSTASLDRRAVRTRVTPTHSPLIDSSRRESLPSGKRDCSPAGTHRVTTFPVNTKGLFYETTKPFERADVHRFASASPQGRVPSRPSNGTARFPSNVSQPNFPTYQQTVSRTGFSSSVSASKLTSGRTDQQMEDLLAYVKEESRKHATKTATIV